MSNYAIILGVDKYKYAQDLPSCENDANLIEGLLKATEKYEILRIANNATKHQVEEEISSFLPTDSKDIDEVLFYFSGHGKQDAQNMHYALFDTDINKINTTSFNNSELDNIIRKYSPKLYVKIIDACQSGVSYIKGIDEVDINANHIVTKDFTNCIFFFSSLRSQASLAGNPYSKFTKAIIDAVENVPTQVVKFADIQNYLSDVFSSSGSIQTPYFSTQCEGTELFCEKNEAVLEYLKSLYPIPSDICDISQSAIDAIDTYLNKCRDETEVKILLETVQKALTNWQLTNSVLSKFYDCQFKENFPYEYNKYRKDSSLITILDNRKEKENLYIEMEYNSVKKENSLLNPFFASYTTLPISYHPMTDHLPSVFSIHLNALNANLPDYVIPFIFIYSPTFFYVFTCTKQFIRKGWREYVTGRHTEYRYTKFEYADFKESDWIQYQTERLQESVDFIEKTLLEYIEVK